MQLKVLYQTCWCMYNNNFYVLHSHSVRPEIQGIMFIVINITNFLLKELFEVASWFRPILNPCIYKQGFLNQVRVAAAISPQGTNHRRSFRQNKKTNQVKEMKEFQFNLTLLHFLRYERKLWKYQSLLNSRL